MRKLFLLISALACFSSAHAELKAPARADQTGGPIINYDVRVVTPGQIENLVAAAKKQDRKAAMALARIFYTNKAWRNEKQGLFYLKMAQTGGAPDAKAAGGLAQRDAWAEAKLEYGVLLRDGTGGVKAAPSEAISAFEAASRAGYMRGNLSIAEMYMKGLGVAADPRKARRYLQAAAAKNHAPAWFEMGLADLKAAGFKPGSPLYDQGYREMSTAANLNHARALAVMGELSLPAAGTQGDINPSIRYFERAVAGGDALAALSLGRFYFADVRFPRDYVRAGTYLRIAACKQILDGVFLYARLLSEQAGDRDEAIAGHVWAVMINEAKLKDDAARNALLTLEQTSRAALSAEEQAKADALVKDGAGFVAAQCKGL